VTRPARGEVWLVALAHERERLIHEAPLAAATPAILPAPEPMEQRRITEADWKIWKRLHAVALERFCQKILKDAARLETGEGSAHERYIKLYQLVTRRDRKLGDIFDGPSRSDAIFRIAAALQARVLTLDEIAEFSEETRNAIEFLSGVSKP